MLVHSLCHNAAQLPIPVRITSNDQQRPEGARADYGAANPCRYASDGVEAGAPLPA
jgi:hypothetical protein